MALECAWSLAMVAAMEASSRESWKLEVSISNHSVMAQGIGAELNFWIIWVAEIYITGTVQHICLLW
jgi:hypothetical protein